ncbi:MAG TPA: hypothetical protein ENJ65_06595 [Candidatus Tenderia electrophaga]|uniref:Elongation factor-1 alpha n=1 Tax=Candidatus Tenderia electrophaga TaxID=1748243 RepID=A0A832J864_9GAMM|nr:hypothetical protein [Candidatus Tenderia electrophaga]
MNQKHRTESCPATRPRYFYDCSLNEKLLYTSFILLAGLAYLMALAYLYTSFDGIDGKPGLSVEDIAETYYGNRSGTRLESAIRGSMAGNIDVEQRNHVIEWLKSGASAGGYERVIKPIFAERCVMCHSPDSGLSIPDLSSYEGVKQVANVDTGVSLHSLMKVSHIHLFGIALVALGIGLIFRFALLPAWFQNTLTLLPFVAIFIDIAAWFLTKWDPVYAYTIIIAGGILGLSWGLQMSISLYQIWFLRCRPETGGKG